MDRLPGNQLVDQRWNFKSQSQMSRMGEGLKVESVSHGQWFNQSCSHNEAFIKTQKDKGARISGFVNMWRCSESGMPGEKLLPNTLILFHVAFPKLYPFRIICWSVSKMFLSFASHSSWLTEAKKMVWESLFYSQLVRRTGNNLDLWLASEVG